MRFGNGSAKELLAGAQPTTAISRSNHALFVTLSPAEILLWNLKPQVLLARVIRSEAAVLKQGPFAGVVWKNDSSVIAVWTTKGYLIYFGITVDKSQERVFEFEFKKEFYYMSGPGEGKGLVPWEIHLQRIIQSDRDIHTGLAMGNNLFMTTKDGFLETRGWDGTLIRSLPLQAFSFLGEPVPADLYISTAASLNTHSAVWVLSDGRAFLALPAENGLNWTGYSCNLGGSEGSSSVIATAASINGKYGLMAVGLNDGSIKVFAMNETNDGLVQVYHYALKGVKEYLQVSSSVGSVTSLDWSFDGLNLAVGWANAGFGVWTTFGRLVSCSITDIDSLANEQVPEKSGSFEKGILDLFWGSDGYELFVLSHGPAAQTILSVQPYLRVVSALNHTQDNLRHPAIVGENVLHLYIGQMTGVEISSPEVQYWRQIQLPPNYLTENWPISCVACGGSGNYIAIAGRRGITHYNVSTNKWKLFNNVQEEREFRCRGGMVWMGEVLVVACQDDITLGHGLRFFLQGSRLDKQYILLTKDLPAAVVHLEALGNFLLVFTSDGVVREFKTELIFDAPDQFPSQPTTGTLKLISLSETKLQGKVHAFCVRSVTWLTGKHHDPKNLPTTLPLLVLQTGSLFLVERTGAQIELHQIAKNVEQFLVAPLSSKVRHLSTTIWIVDPAGMQVWLKDYAQVQKTLQNGDDNHSTATTISPQSQSVNPKEFCLHRIPLAFYPLTVLIEEGFLMGLGHDTHRKTFFDKSVVSFRTQNENHLFLQNILGYLLRKG